MNLPNIKISIRNLWKHKFQSTKLKIGLTAGMVTCILLLRYVSFNPL